MENLVKNKIFWAGKRIFLTGHTGFKGGWLSLWVQQLGAEVHGFSLAPPSEPNFFNAARVATGLAADITGDIRDYHILEKALKNAQPEIIFHLAAQPLVRASYHEPLETLSTNVLGTAHLLEAARHVNGLQAVVVITTDKCYDNREWVYPYRENDPLGGHDPYSASKACAEIVTSSYRASFFDNTRSPFIATARAGNVIGGGDWAEERLVPDCIRSFGAGQGVSLRFPAAIRPWQHVLEPLSGYLKLAEALCTENANNYSGAWNFGPGEKGDATVGEIAHKVAEYWGQGEIVLHDAAVKQPHETSVLRLDITKARQQLGWNPRWSIDRALQETVSWYKAWHSGQDMLAYTLTQIDAYLAKN